MSRPLRVSIAAYTPRETRGVPFDLQRNLAEAASMVELAASEQADLVVLPETFALQGSEDWTALAEPPDGLVISTLSQLARRFNMGIVAGHALCVEDGKYNSAVLIDRDGSVVAIYHKTFPTIWEMERGIKPGTGAKVFDTSFGRLGFAICYDLNFAELRLAYRDLKPDAILFLSAFRGGLQVRSWAFETRSYVISSIIDPKSVVVNPVGRVMAETDVWDRQLTQTVNLDYEVIHYDYTNHTLNEARLRSGKLMELEGAEPEGVMLLTSCGSTSAAEMMREFGWENAEEYFARARRARDHVLAGRPQPMGPRPW